MLYALCTIVNSTVSTDIPTSFDRHDKQDENGITIATFFIIIAITINWAIPYLVIIIYLVSKCADYYSEKRNSTNKRYQAINKKKLLSSVFMIISPLIFVQLSQYLASRLEIEDSQKDESSELNDDVKLRHISTQRRLKKKCQEEKFENSDQKVIKDTSDARKINIDDVPDKSHSKNGITAEQDWIDCPDMTQTTKNDFTCNSSYFYRKNNHNKNVRHNITLRHFINEHQRKLMQERISATKGFNPNLLISKKSQANNVQKPKLGKRFFVFIFKKLMSYLAYEFFFKISIS